MYWCAGCVGVLCLWVADTVYVCGCVCVRVGVCVCVVSLRPCWVGDVHYNLYKYIIPPSGTGFTLASFFKKTSPQLAAEHPTYSVSDNICKDLLTAIVLSYQPSF